VPVCSFSLALPLNFLAKYNALHLGLACGIPPCLVQGRLGDKMLACSLKQLLRNTGTISPNQAQGRLLSHVVSPASAYNQTKQNAANAALDRSACHGKTSTHPFWLRDGSGLQSDPPRSENWSGWVGW